MFVTQHDDVSGKRMLEIAMPTLWQGTVALLRYSADIPVSRTMRAQASSDVFRNGAASG
jgi:hypothetical protein